jgi:alkyl hydroperoxide reductase subunit AhpC
VTIEELLNYDNWACVFADPGNSSGGNCTKELEVIGKCSDREFTREDVEEIIASVDGENDTAAWMGIFKLKDGRYLYAEGSCDYTGWD